jgi:phage nucleotide-binding protein
MSIALTSNQKTKTQKTELARTALSKIVPASQISNEVKMVIYGRNKVGKTRFACSSDLPTLLIDCNDQGWKSVRKRPNVDVYPVEFWDDLDPIYWVLKGTKHKYKIVVVDTVTGLATIGMKWVLGDDAARDAGRDPLMADKRSWGKLGEVLKTTIINFRNLPIHVIFTAQERTTTSEDDEGATTTEIHPEISPSPRSTLLSSVDIIGRLYTTDVEGKEGRTITERRMLLGTHPKYVSGNRFDELKRIERNPNLQNFLDRINQEVSTNGGSSAAADDSSEADS